MPSRRAILWLAESQLDLAREIAAIASLTIVGSGSPSRGTATPIAAALNTANLGDDLRAAISNAGPRGDADGGVDLILILDAGDFGSERSEDDARALAAALARSIAVFAIDPIPGSVFGPAQVEQPSACIVPLASRSRPAIEAGENLASIGVSRLMAITHWCAPFEARLGHLLFDAIDSVVAFMGEPASIDAAITRSAERDSLRTLSGDLVATLRFANGGIASLALSDCAAAWHRTTTLLAPGGRLTLDDDGFELVGADARAIDELRLERELTRVASRAAVAIGRSVNAALEPGSPPARDPTPVLTLCHTAILSAHGSA